MSYSHTTQAAHRALSKSYELTTPRLIVGGGLSYEAKGSFAFVLPLQASLYGATKESDERIAHVYHHLHGIKLTGLRFFTVYGPIGRPDMAYFSFTQVTKHTQLDYKHPSD